MVPVGQGTFTMLLNQGPKDPLQIIYAFGLVSAAGTILPHQTGNVSIAGTPSRLFLSCLYLCARPCVGGFVSARAHVCVCVGVDIAYVCACVHANMRSARISLPDIPVGGRTRGPWVFCA